MSEAAPAGTLTACGFGPNGQFRGIRGNITGQATAVGTQFPSLTIQGAVRPGDSGGGVLNAAGQLVGIVWGRRDGVTYATCGQPVREFLKRILGRESLAKQPPIANSPQSPAPNPTVDWPAWSTEIESRLQSLDAKKQDKGDYLQPGDLNGYLRAMTCPNSMKRQFARHDQLDNRFESIRRADQEHRGQPSRTLRRPVVRQIVGRPLGFSGPLAAAGIIACGLAGRRIEEAGTREQRAKSRNLTLSSLLLAPRSNAHRRR